MGFIDEVFLQLDIDFVDAFNDGKLEEWNTDAQVKYALFAATRSFGLGTAWDDLGQPETDEDAVGGSAYGKLMTAVTRKALSLINAETWVFDIACDVIADIEYGWHDWEPISKDISPEDLMRELTSSAYDGTSEAIAALTKFRNSIQL